MICSKIRIACKTISMYKAVIINLMWGYILSIMLYKKGVILLSLIFIFGISLVLYTFYTYNFVVNFFNNNIDIVTLKKYYDFYIISIQLFYFFIFLILLPYKKQFFIKNVNLLYIYGGIMECILVIIYFKI